MGSDSDREDGGPKADGTGRPRKRRTRRRRVLWAVVLLSPAIALLAYWHFWLWKPVGSGPAGPDVPRTPFASPWTTRKVVLLGIGDSVTAGFGASRGRSYFGRLVVNPPDESGEMAGICLSRVLPNLEARNVAVSGTNSLFHEENIDSLPTFGPEILGIVVMTTGGNDILHDYGRKPPREGAMYGAPLEQAGPWITAFEQRLDRMMAALRLRFPGGCHVFLATIYDPTDGSGSAAGAYPPFMDLPIPPDWPDAMAVLSAYNEAVVRCAAKHDFVHLVDVHAEFLGHGFACRKLWRSSYDWSDPHFWYHDNVEDPNDRGYDALRRLFLLKMANVLPDALAGN